MNLFTRYHLLVLVGSLLTLSGCDTLSSTSQFYHPISATKYPPKPDNYPIEILDNPPPRKFHTIGSLCFKKSFIVDDDPVYIRWDSGYDFMREAVKYNARRAGADAVVLKHFSSDKREFQVLRHSPPTSQDFTYNKPTEAEMISTLQYSLQNAGGPPGFYDTKSEMTYFFNVEMIVFEP